MLLERAKRLRLPIAGVLVVIAVAACAAGAGAAVHKTHHAAASPKKFLKSKGHTADLTMTAALTKHLGEFNFDGYSKGGLVVTVPKGWKVDVAFKNAGMMPHSLLVVPWSASLRTPQSKPAFKGAETPKPVTGSKAGSKVKVTFTASKAGKYRLICAVPGHALAGMWDTLIVKAGAKTATIAAKA